MIIGFIAPKQYGKTTACNIVREYLNGDVAQVNFKDGLIRELKQNFPDLLTYYQHLYKKLDIDELFMDKEPPIRYLMQNYGTEVRRKDNPDYWVEKWQEIINQTEGEHILVDDVRFLNEAETIKNAGGILIRLERTDLTNTDTHTSEQEQSYIKSDHTIICGEGEFTTLEKELKKIIEL